MASTPTLQVNRTLADSYRYVWNNRRDLVAYAFLPVTIVAVARTVVLWTSGDWEVFFDPPPAPDDTGDAPAMTLRTSDLVNAVITLVAYVMFAVAWHRRQLLPGIATTVGAALSWGGRQMRFLGRLVLLMGGLAALTLALTIPLRELIGANPTLAPILFVALMVTIGLVYGRLLLVFPSTAIDGDIGFRLSIALTAGHSWRMLAIAILPPIPLMLAGMIFVSLLMAGIVPAIGPSISMLLVISLAEQAFAFAGIAVGISALSFAYLALTGRSNAA